MKTVTLEEANKIMRLEAFVKEFEKPVFDVVKTAAATGQFKLDELVELYDKLLKTAVYNRLDLPCDRELFNKIPTPAN